MVKFLFIVLFLFNCEKKSGQFEIFTNNFDKTKIICASITEDQNKTIQYKYYNAIIKELAKKEGFKIDTKNCDYMLQFDLNSKPIYGSSDAAYIGIFGFLGVKSNFDNIFYSKELKLDILDKNNNKVVEVISIVDDSNKVKSPVVQCMIKSILKNIQSTTGVFAKSEPFDCQ